MNNITLLTAISILTLTFCATLSPAQRAGAAPATAAAKASYPRLISGAANPDARIALRIARAAFLSDAAHVSDAAYLLRKSEQSLILWPKQPEESEQIPYDQKFIQCKTADAVHPDVYLETAAHGDARFVVRHWHAGAGPADQYDLAVIKSKGSLENIFADVSGADLHNSVVAEQHPLMAGSYLCPWIIRNPENGDTIAIDTDHPAVCLPDWTLYSLAEDGKVACIGKIAFRPAANLLTDSGIATQRLFRLIPQGPLRDIAVLLDDIIGIPREYEGSSQPTAKLRIRVSHMWGNLLFRPWAMEEPPDSRKAIEAVLKQWKRGSPVYGKQYAKLNELYPRALEQLSEYYQSRRKLSPERAKALATRNLDLAFRTNFNL